MDKSKIQSISIILLGIALIITNIRMSSYREDMNSLLKIIQLQNQSLDLMYECHQIEFELFQDVFGVFQKNHGNLQ